MKWDSQENFTNSTLVHVLSDFLCCLRIIPFPCCTHFFWPKSKLLEHWMYHWSFNFVPLILLILIYQTFIIHLEQFSILSCRLSLQSYYYFVKSHFVKTLGSLSLGLYCSVHTCVCSAQHCPLAQALSSPLRAGIPPYEDTWLSTLSYQACST